MPLRTYKPTQQTKNNILQKATELFNESGTASTSMNALAEALGISAGNLQYHYKKKEDVIRDILEEMFKQFDVMYEPVAGPFTLNTLRHFMRINFDIVWKYRFFYRELGALLRNDKILTCRFREIQEQRLESQEKIIKQMASSSKGRAALNPNELHNVVLMGWVLGHTWLPYIESMGQKINETALNQAVEMMVQHYKPYLKDLL